MWIEFKFEPGHKGDSTPAYRFLGEFADAFPKVEGAAEDQLAFRQVSPTKPPEVAAHRVVLKHLRAHDKEGSRWLHLTQDQLVCNFLRLGEKYPGFALLSQEAIAKLDRYLEVCTPVRIKHAAIHYVDVIEIPEPVERAILLRDYFTLGVDLPHDPFGNQASYLIRTTALPTDGTGQLDIQLQYEPPPSKGVFRFRMDWHKLRPYDGEVTPDRIRTDLKEAHESVMRCFRAAFTERTWSLFQPSE
jgi:uncharacterized protein (TIGR04255 family)